MTLSMPKMKVYFIKPSWEEAQRLVPVLLRMMVFLNLRDKLKKEDKANEGFALGKIWGFFTPSLSCLAQTCLRTWWTQPLVGTGTEMTEKMVRKFQPKLQPCVSSEGTGVILRNTVRGWGRGHEHSLQRNCISVNMSIKVSVRSPRLFYEVCY